MLEIKVNDLPVIAEEDFTANDRFLIIDDGRARLLTKAVFESWISNNLQGAKGEQGVAGRDGAKGADGINGTNGTNGLSAYQLAVAGGFVGTQAQWEASLKGSKGDKGLDGSNGWSPVFRAVARGSMESVLQLYDWTGGTGTKPTLTGYVSESGIVSNIINASNIKGFKGDRGDKGDKGDKGDRGDTGAQGIQGISPYQVAVLNGFVGTEEEWLLSLQGSEISQDPTNIITQKIDGLYAPVTNPLAMAISIDALEDKNIMTDAQKNKLESLKTSNYLGTFLSPEEIPLEGSVSGNYADVNSGLEGVKTERWIYDANSLIFVKAVTIPDSETPESIKQKYESNPNTNAFTDADKEKLTLIPTEGVKGDTGAQGIQGIQGEKGDKGDTGERGLQGVAGMKGDNGDTVIDANTGTVLKIWTGTQAEYDAVITKDLQTLYLVKSW